MPRNPTSKPAPDGQADAIAELIEALRPVRVGRAGYQRVDRYRDFHQVFHGTPAGQRVLAQIVELLEGPVVTVDELGNHALLAARAWGKRCAMLIVSFASLPPADTGETAKEEETAHG